MKPTWCITVASSGRKTIRTAHDYRSTFQANRLVWVCQNCGGVK